MRAQVAGVLLAVGASGFVAAQADYVIAATSGGLSSVNAVPGQVVAVDVGLTSNASDAHNSAIFRVVFSEPGIEYVGYTWSLPYGATFDASTPSAASLPAIVSGSSLEGASYPSGVADVELSNVTDSGVFSTGTIAQLLVRVPLGWSGSGAVQVTVVPDTIANGFDVVPTTSGGALTLVIPTPGSMALALVGVVGALRRRPRK